MGDASVHRRRWAFGGLVAYAVIVGAVLFAPVSYGGIVDSVGEWGARTLSLDWFGSGWIEFSANVLMFTPLGFFLAVLTPRWWHGFLIAAMLSASAELIQAVIPSRQPSVRDIVANTLGAVVGAGVAWLVVTRAGRRSSQSLDGAHREISEL